MIVLCGGIKGGIGKTTVATNLAVIRANERGPGQIALIDADPQESSLKFTQLVVLPFRPASYDVWTIGDLTQLIEEIRAVNPNLRALAFINQGDHQGNDNSEAAEMLRESETVSVIDVCLGYRKAFRNTATGKAVTELTPQDPKAVTEMMALYAAVFSPIESHNDTKKNLIDFEKNMSEPERVG